MPTSGMSEYGVFDANDLADICSVVEAVCTELGILHEDQSGRERVASNIMRSWESGLRTPLGLVKAGLDSIA